MNWTEIAEAAAKFQAEYKAPHQARPSSRRIKVRLGSAKVGDARDGLLVTGLGRDWVETIPDHDASVWGLQPGNDHRVRVQYAYLG